MTRRQFSLLFPFVLLLGVHFPAIVGTQELETDEPVVIGKRLQIESQILDEPRPLLIYKPAGYEEEMDRYPVLYLLDGQQNFHHTTGIVNFLAASERIPKMLVVAIPNTNRNRDLTPPTESASDFRWAPTNGGADVFLQFISNELIPWVEKNYRTRPYKILVGHSFGGLFAIHVLTTRSRVFNAYIAIDPSLHWNEQGLIAQADAFFEAAKEINADLFITATGEGGSMRAGVRKLASVLDEKAPIGFRWSLHWMPEENHISIVHRSTYLGLDTIFDGWHLARPWELYDKGGLRAVHRHFEEGGERFGYERKTSAFTVSMIVAGLLWAGRLEEAGSVLLHDGEAYPPPWNQLDALARAYAKCGNTERVIRYYTLSLKENAGNENAKKQLTELGVDIEALLAR